jgi:hypothetical protein
MLQLHHRNPGSIRVHLMTKHESVVVDSYSKMYARINVFYDVSMTKESLPNIQFVNKSKHVYLPWSG